MQVIILDFETFYEKKSKYSLAAKEMTYEKYIRDERFEVIGLAVKIGKRKAEWLAPHEIQGWLDHIEVAYGWENVRMVAFNARFDAAILGWKYGIYPGQIADPMLMSRASQLWDGHSLDNVTRQLALQYNFGSTYDDADGNFSYGMYEKVEEENGEIFGSNGFGYTSLVMKGTEVHDADGKHLFDFTDEEYDAYGEYAKTDVDLTWAAYNFFVHRRKFPEQEIEVMTATIETFTYPVLELDRKVLEIVDHNINSERQVLLDKVGISLEEVRSDAKFAEALIKLGVKPPTKITTTGKEKYAFAKKDLEFLALLDHEDQNVVELVEARLGNKSSQAVTRVKAFLELQERGNLPIPLEYYAAHTGRWGGCLTADTLVLCLTAEQKVVEKRIVDVLLSDLVWDGVEFVEHEGVKFSGYQEVITYDGITGTKCHPVFISDTETISLSEAMRTGAKIVDCQKPKLG